MLPSFTNKNFTNFNTNIRSNTTPNGHFEQLLYQIADPQLLYPNGFFMVDNGIQSKSIKLNSLVEA